MEYIGSVKKDNILYANCHRKIVICGAGFWGNKLLHYLVYEIKINPMNICICDSDDKKIGRSIDECRIISYKDAIKYYKNGLYLVMGKYDMDIIKMLMKNHIKGIHLFRPEAF